MNLRQAWAWIKAKPARMIVSVVAMALLIVALIPTVITWAPHWLASTSGLNADQRAAEVGRVRTALLAVIAGSIAVVGAIYTARTFALNRQAHELDRQGQITERFTRAVDQLGNTSSLEVRLGGIYALERLARESRDDHGPIMEILTAYIREHAPQATRVERASDRSAGSASPPAANDATGVGNSLATDVQAVLTVLGRRTVVYDTGRLDLTAADLSRANLIEANLQRAWLPEAKLIGANLVGANLKEAYLGGANLQGAYLNSANLQDTLLGGGEPAGGDPRRREAAGRKPHPGEPRQRDPHHREPGGGVPQRREPAGGEPSPGRPAGGEPQ